MSRSEQQQQKHTKSPSYQHEQPLTDKGYEQTVTGIFARGSFIVRSSYDEISPKLIIVDHSIKIRIKASLFFCMYTIPLGFYV